MFYAFPIAASVSYVEVRFNQLKRHASVALDMRMIQRQYSPRAHPREESFSRGNPSFAYATKNHFHIRVFYESIDSRLLTLFVFPGDKLWIQILHRVYSLTHWPNVCNSGLHDSINGCTALSFILVTSDKVVIRKCLYATVFRSMLQLDLVEHRRLDTVNRQKQHNACYD